MGKKRKRPIKDRGPPSSHPSITSSPRRFRNPTPSTGRTSHPVISLYYRQVVTLREYLLEHLPVTSKSRRRRILAGSRADDPASQTSQTLAHLLDSTLVGVLKESSPTLNSERQKEYLSFTQSQSRSILVSTDTGPTCPQSEVRPWVPSNLTYMTTDPRCRWLISLFGNCSTKMALIQSPSICWHMDSNAQLWG